MTHPDAMQPIPVDPDSSVAVAVGGEFTLALPVFEGPLALLLHLIESRQLDVMTVPLAEVADAYVGHLARHPVDAANLSEFVAIAAQLIYLKSRRLLPTEPLPALPDGSDEVDEEELRRRLVEYRVLRDAAAQLGERDGVSPTVVPREITIGQQIAVLREALAGGGRVLLQTILARCRSRTEAAITFLATLELVRRRQVSAEQHDLFGPIVIEQIPERAP
jgi:chromatin segregation and condensation protein Rec8/ScpA/Scc1 (kleisin family)